MGRAEGIVDEGLSKGCQFPGELRGVLLFAGMKAEVLQHEDLAVTQGGHRPLRLGADAIAGVGYLGAEKLLQALDNGGQRSASTTAPPGRPR